MSFTLVERCIGTGYSKGFVLGLPVALGGLVLFHFDVKPYPALTLILLATAGRPVGIFSWELAEMAKHVHSPTASGGGDQEHRVPGG